MHPVLKTVFFSDVHSAFGLPHFFEMIKVEDCEMVGVILGASKETSSKCDSSIIDKWGVSKEANIFLEAKNHRIPVLHYEKDNDIDIEKILKKIKPHIIVSAGFRKILPKEILEIPTIAAVNFHPSLLPKMRGCDPWFWTILKGERESAATVHYMEESVDSGEIILQTVIPLASDERAGTLFQKTLVESLRMIAPLYKMMRQGNVTKRKQDENLASIYPAPNAADYRIDWNNSAERIYNLIRASKYAPGARTTYKNKDIIITEAQIATDTNISMRPGKPGYVIKASEHALVVRTGDGSLVIRLIEYENRQWNASRFVSYFKCPTCDDVFI